MKKFFVITAALLSLSLSSGALAQEMTTYLSAESDFSFYEFGFTQYDGVVIQGGVTASWENGLFVDVWGSQALDGDIRGAEYDYTVGWGGKCGSLSCTVSVSLFDLPTPNVGDFDFTGSDIIRFRAEVSDTITVDKNDSIGWMLGADQITGLIETNLWRSNVSWNHVIDTNWSTSLLAGATHNTDADFTSVYWSAKVSRSFGDWSTNFHVGGYEHQSGVTAGFGVSRTW